MRLIGLSGSQREHSSNTRLLRAAERLVPAGVTLTVECRLSDLPHFSPDLPMDGSHALASFSDRVRHADGLVVSSPVYAGGYPGTLKNALDWLVGTDAFVAKPFMLLCASPRMFEVQETLIKVLTTMSGIHVGAATITLPLLGRDLTVEQIVADAILAGEIRAALLRFSRETSARLAPGPVIP